MSIFFNRRSSVFIGGQRLEIPTSIHLRSTRQPSFVVAQDLIGGPSVQDRKTRQARPHLTQDFTAGTWLWPPLLLALQPLAQGGHHCFRERFPGDGRQLPG